jgi:bifunctional oligoribonuclease and PAP phosphatase NrnA
MSNLQPIKVALERAQRVLIVSHVMPDGDTIGSALGLAWALRSRGMEVRLACADPVPALLRFLPGAEAFADRGRSDEQVVVAVDCSDQGRMGHAFEHAILQDVPLINIDHHVTNTLYGTYNHVSETAATAELVLEVIAFLGIPLDERAAGLPIATCLLTGIITDTRCFRTHNTTPHALRAALKLIEVGASLTDVTDAIYNHLPLAMLRLWGPALAQVQQTGDIVWTEVTLAMLRAAELGPEASDGLVNYLSTFHEARVAMVLQEQEDGRVDVSLRSVPAVNVAVVARALGGGGHTQAAGAMLPGPLTAVRERVLAMLHTAVEG